MPPPIPGNEARRATRHRVEPSDAPLEPVLGRLARLAARSLGAPIAIITLIDGHHQERFKACFGRPPSELPGNDYFRAHALVADDVFVIGDATQDQRFRDSPWVAGDPHIRFYAGVALRTADQELPLGALAILNTKPRPNLSSKQAMMLRDLATLA